MLNIKKRVRVEGWPDLGHAYRLPIREFREPDLAAIFRIYADSKLDELRFEEKVYTLVPLEQDERRFAEFRESDVYVYQEGEILAYGALFGSQIRAVFVHSTARGRGIGRKMLEFLLAKTSGDVSLNVAKSNVPAKNLYERTGFKVVREFTTSYGGIVAIANEMMLKK